MAGILAMWISMDDAIQIYARFWWARHGTKGVRPVRDKAQYLQAIGDAEGHRVWSRVAAEIERRREQNEARN
jgi:hypothetical protein